MRGLKKYHNKYRAYVVDSDGKHHQEYFDTKDLAVAFLNFHRPPKVGNANFKKKENANADLPVGLVSTIKTKKTNVGLAHYTTIVATVVLNGSPKTFTRVYGNKRSKSEAIKLCLDWRLNMLVKT